MKEIAAQGVQIIAPTHMLVTLNEKKEIVPSAYAKAAKEAGLMSKLLGVLVNAVKSRGIFSDWPATVTDYANCMSLD
jgi:glycerophosphoryl diester phosphodiesterase